MSTIFAFDTDTPVRSTPLLAADKVLVHNTTLGRKENLTAALMAESGRTVTAGTTSGAFTAYGITQVSTLATVATLTDPVQAGQETTFIFPSSTAIQTISPVGATILGSTVSPTGATKITHAGTSDALSSSMTLIARSTAQWAIKSLVAGTGLTST